MAKTKKQYYSLRAYFTYISTFKFRVMLLLLLYTFSAILMSIVPIFVGSLVGELAAPNPDQEKVMLYVGALIACSGLHLFVWHASELSYRKFILLPVYTFENILFNATILKPYPYFTDKFTGKISANISTVAQEFRSFLDSVFYSYVGEIVRMVTVIFILFSVNIYTGLLFAFGLVCMFIVGRVTIRKSNRYEKIFTDVASTKTGFVVDSIANFSNVKSFSKEIWEINNIKDQVRKSHKAGSDSFLWNIVFWSSVGFFVRLFIWPLAIVLNVWLFSIHEISIAELTTLLSVLLLFSDFIWSTIWSVSQFNLRLARIEEAYTYLFGKTNIVKDYLAAKSEGSKPRKLNSEFSVRNLLFSYPDKRDKIVLDISIDIKKGEKIGLVGKSGSGKSTFAKLLLGYYPVENGEILIDDESVTTTDVSRLVSFVPQDTSLFHRSIADNIAYATDTKVSREQIVAAAKLAHADEFISEIDEGYDALVGERGVKLSGGQRQRIAIARAILKDSPILVLDEATSALDSESEKLIQQSLRELMKNRTSIVIAHRLSTIAHLDRILVLEKGKIVEQGTHKELLARNGTYAKLWSHQSGGFLED
ncbi:ABC transporter ATP-binding protein [Candidatus Saccharibacteria bacterium]|nr:ABC transporter ATP-binding protein [Candidatus Saccharibacteria bacterium]